MPISPRLHWPALSPEATLPKSGFPVCPDAGSSGGLAQAVIFQLDRVLRRWQGIYEFSQSPDCLLRVARRRASQRIELPDGAAVRPGDEILEIHWWNEHVARLVADKPALARAKYLLALVQHSFQQLARYLAAAPEAANVRFVHGNAVLPMRGLRNEIAARVRPYGFVVIHREAGILVRVHDFFEQYLVWALLWAFHHRKPEMKNHSLRRVDLWAARGEFLSHCRPAPGSSLAARQEVGEISRLR